MNGSKNDRDADKAPVDITWSLFGHAAFQFLNAGCELGLFELLNADPYLSQDEIEERLRLAPHPARCLLFALTAMRMIERDADGRYSNGPHPRSIFFEGQWESFVDIVRFEARFAYVGEIDLVESLRDNTNVGLRRFPGFGTDLYHRLSEHPDLKLLFFRYMSAWTTIGVSRMLERVKLSQVRAAVDVGGGDATAAVAIAKKYPRMRINCIDLPDQVRLARKKVSGAGLQDRVSVIAADIFASPLPSDVDCFFFFHVLVIWPVEVIRQLLARAFQSLRPGGIVVILNSMSNDTEDGPLMAALDTAYFLSLPAEGGMIYPWYEYESCLWNVGFGDVQRVYLDLWTPQGVITAVKPNNP